MENDVVKRKELTRRFSRPLPIFSDNFLDSEEEDDEEYDDVKVEEDIGGASDKDTTPSILPTRVTLSQKDIGRTGFLYKLGGVDRDQGWKKRWFTFDSSALKYFKDNKTSISLRIIPVAIMNSVEPVTESQQRRWSTPDIFSANRHFQFTLECAKRTFQFGTDTLENCQQWQSSLMAAIIQYKKAHPEEMPPGGNMSFPDISGFVKINDAKKRHFLVLKGDLLRYYYNEEDFHQDCPAHELPMSLTSVKEVSVNTLQLDKFPDQKFLMQFGSDTDAMRWKTYLENSIANAIGDDTILKEVQTKEENRMCADCATSDAVWASINLGITLCPKCAGHHRGLGVGRSKVRSLRMDNVFKQNGALVQLLHVIGNQRANAFWMKDPSNTNLKDINTPEIIRKKHIHEKYAQKKYADIVSYNNKEELNKMLVAAVKDDDILGVMKTLFSGADMHFEGEGQSKSVAALVSECENHVLREFLEQNINTDVSIQADETVSDRNNKKSLHHQGYLEKAGPNLKGFLKRWCVLHYGRITYYDDDLGTNEKGCIDLSTVTSISIPNESSRANCFDINTKLRGRTYRLAASDVTSQRDWISHIVSVCSPLYCNSENDCTMAGLFYYKDHLSTWTKVWLEFANNCLFFYPTEDDAEVKTFELCKGVRCQPFNVGKHSDAAADDLRALSRNQTIELLPPNTERLVHIQGQTLKDTKILFSLLELALGNMV